MSFNTSAPMDPIMRALLHNTKLHANMHVDPGPDTRGPGFKSNEPAALPSRSYSNPRSSSNRSMLGGTCKLPQLTRSTSASVIKKGLGGGDPLRTVAAATVCTSPGQPVKSTQKFSAFEQLDTVKISGPEPVSDWQLPTLRFPLVRRSHSNPERQRLAVDTCNQLGRNQPKMSAGIERGCYPTEFPSNPNQIVYGYSMSPHPERNGGFRRAHCPIGDQYYDLDARFPAL